MGLLIQSLLPEDTESWRSILIEWGQLLDRYEELCRDPRDVAYWYGEVPLTGLLASAAWRVPGGAGLLELSAKRQVGEAGATDAWIRTPKGLWYAIEAKVCWLGANDTSPTDRIDKERQAACKQLRDLHPKYRLDYRLDHGVALCYVVPSLREGTFDIVQRVAEQYCKSFPTHLVATYQPLDEAPEDEGKHFPGIVLVGQQVW